MTMDVEQAADRLYEVGLSEFTRERQRLARDLRQSGEAERAEAVAALPKPTLAAWLLNQLARRHRHEVDLLLDAGHRLLRTQRELVGGGDRDAFERARQAEGEALKRLEGRLRRLLEEIGGASAPVVQQVEETLRLAAVDEQGRELLARGRFVKALSQGGGFAAFGEAAAQAPHRQAAGLPPDQLREAQAALRLARAELRRLEREQQQLEGELERRRGELELARAASAQGRRRLEGAQRAVGQAEQTLARLQRRGRR